MNRRDFFCGSAAAATAFAAASQARAQQSSSPKPSLENLARGAADLALHNAKVITLDPKRPTASAVLVREGKIVMIGSDAEVLRAAGSTPRYNAGGRTVMPGFVDNHCHVEDSCITADHHPSLRGLQSIEAMVERMRAHAQTRPKGEYLVFQGGGFPNNVSEKRWMTRQDIDRASTDHPIMVILGIHASILNTPAWKQSGYWEPGNDRNVLWTDGSPRMGSHIHRGPDGHPTGVGSEIWEFRPKYTAEQYKESMRRHFKDWFLSKGLTSITTIPNESPGEFQALQELQREGGLPSRFRVYPIVPHASPLAHFTGPGFTTGLGDAMMRFGGVKFFIDNGSDGMGGRQPDLKWTREGLTEALIQCQRGNIQTIMHVVTPDGMDLTLDCLEAAQKAYPRDIRHRIDHLTPTDINQIRRTKALNVTLGITAPQAPPSNAIPPPGGGYGRNHRYRTLLNEGVSTILVLDAAGPGGYYEVWRGIANVVSESGKGGSAAPGEAVTLDEAMRMWTLWPAESNGEGHEKGSLEVGKYGDMIVLSADPRGKSSFDLYKIQTETTICGGAITFEVPPGRAAPAPTRG